MEFAITDPHYREKTRAQDALYQVIDPELFVNVVDLGLIYDLDFTEDDKINVTMTLSTPHCPMGEAITNGVNNALSLAFPDRKINLDLVFEPQWSFEKLTAEGRAQLGI